eukprot:TRINITY_DN11244_c2_g1_i1.p1 TRINITY_DN11244_c2_g1~~TRINITY_DN11244_c2_g1_i1.p1  ORF type:complete len:1140 (+),score=332.44 TRINITY_DN11244_c2_g1_i1:95-3421(+)
MGKKAGGVSENIRVVVRKRPMSSSESQDYKEIVDLDLAMGSVAVKSAVGDASRWTFDAVYDNTFTQGQIFNKEVMPLVQSVLDGYNATVFAYGQSGSGKTFTMTGVPGTPSAGIMPHAMNSIFEGIKLLESPQKSYRVKISYIELYNGKAYDLIASGTKKVGLEIKNFHVVGAESPDVTSPSECVKIFNEGTEKRATASTELNNHSSRSHSIFTLTILSTDHEADAATPIIMQSKLNLCDLAGSERQSKTNASGETLRQGCNINLSLSALGTVIDTLVKGKGHVPYRSSPLTMLLKDSLGGNSKTVMFANIGPADVNTSETISTLRFADRAKQIENKPVKNLDPKDQLIADLKQQVETLKKRLARGGGDLESEDRLREQIEALELEKDQDKQSFERDKLDMETEVQERDGRIKELMALVEKAQVEAQTAMDEKRIEENVTAGLRDELLDMKRMLIDFIQRITPAELLEQHLSQFSDGPDGLWDRNKIYGMMDVYSSYTRNHRGVSSEEIQRKIADEKTEWEQRLKQQQETLERERKFFQEELGKEKAMRSDESDTQSRTKSELQSKIEEIGRLKEKINRDLEKFKQKLLQKQQDRDDMAAKLQSKEEQLQEKVRELERMKTTLKEQEGSIDQQIKTKLAEMKKLHESELEQEKRTLEGKIQLIDGEKAELLSRINDMDIQLKQTVRKSLVQKAHGVNKNSADGDGNDTAMNEGFLEDDGELENLQDDCIDKDMFEELHIQVRLQCRLQRLRHLQQKQLDGLIDRYHKAALDNRGKITEERMKTQIEQAVREKEDELEKTKAEHQKTQDKLVKGINKKLAEFHEMENKLKEDQQTLEEENKELADLQEKMERAHEQALESAATLQGILEQKEVDFEAERRRTQRELHQSNIQLQQCEEDIQDLRKHVARNKDMENDYGEMRKEYELTKISLRDQRGQVDALRARLKNMEDMWSEEKDRSEKLRREVNDAEVRVKKTESHYNDVVKDHGIKMTQLLNEKVEEQRQHFAEQLREHQLHEKQIKERLKKARNNTAKAKQKFDEMVLENERLQTQFEEFKISAFRFHQESEALEVEDSAARIKELISNQQNQRKEQADAFTGRPSSAMGRGYM